jgi:hypothetical protein
MVSGTVSMAALVPLQRKALGMKQWIPAAGREGGSTIVPAQAHANDESGDRIRDAVRGLSDLRRLEHRDREPCRRGFGPVLSPTQPILCRWRIGVVTGPTHKLHTSPLSTEAAC